MKNTSIQVASCLASGGAPGSHICTIPLLTGAGGAGVLPGGGIPGGPGVIPGIGGIAGRVHSSRGWRVSLRTL